MENKPEVIRHEMQQTRSSLTEKLEALEQHVLGTVQSATSAVQETVANVKDAVQGTVSTVKDSIDETMCTVKTSIEGTVDNVKETFDLERQVCRHPLLMVGGAIGVGFLGGRLLQHQTQSSAPAPDVPSPTSPSHLTSESWSAVRRDASAAAENRPMQAARPAAESWSNSLLASLEPEVQKVKGLAIGALFNVVKGLLQEHLPRSVEPQFVEMVDNVTRKMGGMPIEGSLLEEWKPSTENHARQGYAART